MTTPNPRSAVLVLFFKEDGTRLTVEVIPETDDPSHYWAGWKARIVARTVTRVEAEWLDSADYTVFYGGWPEYTEWRSRAEVKAAEKRELARLRLRAESEDGAEAFHAKMRIRAGSENAEHN